MFLLGTVVVESCPSPNFLDGTKKVPALLLSCSGSGRVPLHSDCAPLSQRLNERLFNDPS